MNLVIGVSGQAGQTIGATCGAIRRWRLSEEISPPFGLGIGGVVGVLESGPWPDDIDDSRDVGLTRCSRAARHAGSAVRLIATISPASGCRSSISQHADRGTIDPSRPPISLRVIAVGGCLRPGGSSVSGGAARARGRPTPWRRGRQRQLRPRDEKLGHRLGVPDTAPVMMMRRPASRLQPWIQARSTLPCARSVGATLHGAQWESRRQPVGQGRFRGHRNAHRIVDARRRRRVPR